jgi:hypothetical protein
MMGSNAARAVLVSCLIVLAFLPSARASAGSLLANTQISGSCTDSNFETSGMGPVTSNLNCSFSPEGVTLTAAAAATADYGVLGVSLGNAISIIPGGPIAASSGGFAQAVSQDALPISNAPLSGFLRITFRLQGHLGLAVTSPESTLALVGGSLSVNNNSIYTRAIHSSAGPSEFGSLIATIPYSDGATGLIITLQFQSSCLPLTTVSQHCSVTADFLHTAVVAGTEVLDDNLNVVEGAIITSESGFDYQAGVPPAHFLSYPTGVAGR